jgi:predicted PurR-regulated permease PerM
MIEIRLSSLDGTKWRRRALTLLLLLLAIWMAFLAREIWLPLLIAFLIAMVLDPLVDRMESRGWSRLKSTMLIFVAFFTVVGVGLTLALPAVVTQTVAVTNSIGQYLPGESETQTKKSLTRLLNRVHATAFLRETVLKASSQISAAFNNASTWIGKSAEGMVSNLIWIIVIPIVAFYTLKDLHLIYARLLMFVPRDNRSFAQQLINEVSAIFVRYLRGLLIVCALNAMATAAVLSLVFRLPNALALGAISGALYTVPYLGAALTVLIIAGVALMSGPVVNALLIVVTMILLHSVLFDQIITPRIVGQHVGLHPILSLIALLIGGSALGILGMILAVPLAATVQMILLVLFPKLSQPIEVPAGEELHAIATAMAEEQPEATETEALLDVHKTIVAAVDMAEENALAQEEPAGLREPPP